MAFGGGEMSLTQHGGSRCWSLPNQLVESDGFAFRLASGREIP